ncbi:MAG: DUF3805 domain-containing protein [Bacteroides sp.]|nr:DUF3805 domain-containing protein [Bacteroides sp.]
MKQSKKFISPGAWFSMNYPATWNEFEDSESTFLFYNPDNWTGNFRISAYRGGQNYAATSVEQELRDNVSAQPVRVGAWHCAYSKEMFEEEGVYYTTHLWLTGKDDLLFECSMTVPKGAPVSEAEEVIASLAVRPEGKKYPAEVIPVRLSEVYQINEAYEWVDKTVKEVLSKDFQGSEEDILKMQEIIEKGIIPPKKKEAWLAMGIALCVILANEVDGWEWRTLIDGNREVPILQHIETGQRIDPMKLTWSKVKAGEKCNLIETYQELV